MIAMRGRLQKKGEVIHTICDRVMDHDDMLRSIGRMDFTVAPGRGDGARNGGGPDPRDPTWTPRDQNVGVAAVRYGGRAVGNPAYPQPRFSLIKVGTRSRDRDSPLPTDRVPGAIAASQITY